MPELIDPFTGARTYVATRLRDDKTIEMPTERELWVIHRERVKTFRAYAFIAILIFSLALWGGIWFAVAAVSAWIQPWL